MQNTFAILGAALLLGLTSAVPTPAAAPVDAPTNASTAWPQFHGPGASGVAADDHAVPLPFGRDTNLLWTTSIPVGHSSACIYGDRIFITGFLPESKTMETLGLDRATGKVLWRREVKPDKIEKVHRISHPVTSTPATDGRSVFVYFGSYGLIAYDFEGGLRWERRLPSPVIFLDFGSGTSPIVAGDKVIVDIQNGADSHVLAVNVTNGATFWKADKPTARGWSTPIVWHEGALDCVGVFNASRFTAYNLKDGQERWWVSALPNQVCATPVVGNGMLYLNGTGVYGESDNLVSPPAFKEALALYDKDKDGLISAEEIPKTALYVDRRNSQQSGNQRLRDMLFPRAKATDRMDEKDWDAAVGRLKSFSTSSMMSSAVLAIRSGGQGDVTSSHVAWTQTKGVPEVPSPLLYRDRLYFVKNGGVLLCRNPQTGQVLFEERLGAGGGYFASPVGGGGFIYLASDLGVVTVCAAGDGLKVTSQADLKEPIFATPALASGRLYVRTKQHLMAFGQ